LSVKGENDGKKRLLRPIYIKILVFLGLIAVYTVSIQPLQYLLDTVMTQIRTGIIGTMEEITGLNIRYSSIRPSVFGSFDIRNLRVTNNDETIANVSGISIKFSVFQMIFNRKAFVHTVLVDKPTMLIDMERDGVFFDKLSAWLDTQESDTQTDLVLLQQIAQFLPKNIDYQIRDGYFRLLDKERIYLVNNININVKGIDDDIHLDGRFAAEFKYDGLAERTITVRTEASLNALCSDDLEKGTADIDFSYITCFEQDDSMIFRILPFHIFGTYNDNAVTARRQPENDSFNFKFYYETDTGAMNAQVSFDSFKLSDVIIFPDRFNEVNHLLQMQLNGASSFTYANKESFSYNFDLTGKSSSSADTFIINASGNEEAVSVADFFISSSKSTAEMGFFQGSAGFKGDVNFSQLQSSGTLFFDNFTLTGKDHLSAVFDISSRRNLIQITSEKVNLARAHINDFGVSLYPSQKDIGISASGYGMDIGLFFMDAVYNLDPKQLEASLIIDSMSFFELSEYARPFADYINIPGSREVLQDGLINTEIFFSTDFDDMVFNAPNISFIMGSMYGMLSLLGTDTQVTLSEGVFYNNENELHVTADVNYSNPKDLNFSLNAGFQELSWHIKGQILDGTTLIINDPNGLHVYGNMSDKGAISGYIEGVNYPIPMNTNPIYLNFYSTLIYDSHDFWNVNINHLRARDINAIDGDDFLRISGLIDQDGASFRELVYNDERGFLIGSADFSWDPDFSYLGFLVNITDAQEGGELYHIEGIYKDEKFDLRASISDMSVNRFVKWGTPIRLSADMNVTWESIESFNAKIDLKSFNTRIQNNEIQVSVGVNLSNDELLIENLDLDFRMVNALIPEFRINRKEGIAKTKADVQGFALERDFKGYVDIDFKFEELDSWLEIAKAARNFDGKITIGDIHYGDEKPDDIVFNFAGKDGGLSVNGGIRNMIRLEMDSNGNVFAGLSAPFPIQGTVVGTFKDWNIDLYCRNFYIDLASLYYLVASSNDFKISGGYITGDINLLGPVWNPQFFGTGIGTSLRFQAPLYISSDIRAVPFYVLAEGYEMTFGPVNVAAGPGSGSVSGWLLFENWSPSAIGIDLTVPKDSPVPYDFNITGFIANGHASGDLNLLVDMDNYVIGVNGNLFTNDAELGMVVDNFNRAGDSEQKRKKFDAIVELSVTTGSMVEFIWPTSSPIIRANPEMGAVVNVTADTAASHYSITSDVRIRSGEIFYFDRSFFIREGTLILRENETGFNPLFSTRAEIRDRTDTGNVTISMIVENQPLLTFQPRFESNPGLTQLEIYSILGQNFSSLQGEDNTDAVQRFLLSSSADVVTQIIASTPALSQLAFFRQFEKQTRDFLRLDMFSVRTRFLQNAVVTAGAIGFGQSTVDSSRIGFSNLIDNTTVFIGKYIGQNMFVHGMLTAKYDENSILFGGLTFELDIGIELQTPFVNIRWDFVPKHPENLWVSDNSITLSWSKSF